MYIFKKGRYIMSNDKQTLTPEQLAQQAAASQPQMPKLKEGKKKELLTGIKLFLECNLLCAQWNQHLFHQNIMAMVSPILLPEALIIMPRPADTQVGDAAKKVMEQATGEIAPADGVASTNIEDQTAEAPASTDVESQQMSEAPATETTDTSASNETAVQ